MDIGTGGNADDTKALSLDIPAGVNATLILDPLDPFYYFSGAIMTPKQNTADSNRKPKPDGSVEDNFAKLGKGTSFQGLIPFRPATTYGIENQVKNFSGERVLVGTFQLPDLPILASGYRIEGTKPAEPGLGLFGVGFNQPLSSPSLKLFVNIALGSKTSQVSVDFDPLNPLAVPEAIAMQLRQGLATQVSSAPAESEATTQVPVVREGGVVSGAIGQTVIAPGSWVTLYGANLSATTRTWRADDIHNGVLPTSLDGVSVRIDGKPAAVAYISPTQLNVLAPADIHIGTVQVQVSSSHGSSAAIAAMAATVAPALFDWQAAGGTRYAVASDLNYQPLGPSDLLPGANPRPARPGETIILWGTGFGPTNPAFPSGAVAPSALPMVNTPVVTVGGVQADLVSATLIPGNAGLYQLAVRIPDAGEGDLPVVAAVGGFSSQPDLYLSVKR